MRSDPPVHVDVDELTDVVVGVLRRHAVPEDAARLQSELLVAAELSGHPSHGVRRLVRVAERLAAGVADPVTTGRHTWTRTALLEVDGEQGLGPVVGKRALDAICARARTTGVAAAVIRHNNHLGMLSWYVEQVAAAGQLALATCTSEALVHPHGGRRPLIGTNPLAIGVPATPDPLVLDMATAIVSMGKVHDHAQRGVPLPPGWALDAAGDPTTDPARAAGGALAPYGGAKGYALGIALEVLVASLTGSATGTAVHGTLDSDRPSTKGDVFIVFDAPGGGAADLIGDYLQCLRDSEPLVTADPVRVPGDRARSRARAAREHGLDIDSGVWRDLRSLLHGGRDQAT